MKKKDLPSPDDVPAVLQFAMSFDGYKYYGSLEAAFDEAQQQKRESIEQLRNELFCTARAGRFTFGSEREYLETYKVLYPLFLEMCEL